MASESKEDLRRRFRQERRRAQSAAAAAISRSAAAALPPMLRHGRHLGMYWPIGAEPDLRALAQNAATGELALPAVVAGHLLYRAWRPGEALVPDACRIPAPAGPSALRPDDLSLLLVPALALDQHGIRLGSGGGWYDRLRADPAWRAIPALAVLPSACITRDLPRDPWDVPFDGWLDERGLHWLQAV